MKPSQRFSKLLDPVQEGSEPTTPESTPVGPTRSPGAAAIPSGVISEGEAVAVVSHAS